MGLCAAWAFPKLHQRSFLDSLHDRDRWGSWVEDYVQFLIEESLVVCGVSEPLCQYINVHLRIHVQINGSRPCGLWFNSFAGWYFQLNAFGYGLWHASRLWTAGA